MFIREQNKYHTVLVYYCMSHLQQNETEVKMNPNIDFKEIQFGNCIGRGYYGNVYEAMWREMTVAVKMVSTYDFLTSDEVKVLAALPKHPNVLTFFGVAEEGDWSYIVTDLAPNESLYKRLHVKKVTHLPDQSLGWAQQIADGMYHLHSHDVVHRDLKSKNIVLTFGLVAKVCDFGTARAMAETTNTFKKGTYGWMAPEVITNKKINKMCDVFSYGMVLYEIYSCKKPYAGYSCDTYVANAVLEGKRPDVPETVPPFLHSLLKACWKEEPNERPQFEAIAHAIQTQTF